MVLLQFLKLAEWNRSIAEMRVVSAPFMLQLDTITGSIGDGRGSCTPEGSLTVVEVSHKRNFETMCKLTRKSWISL